MSIPKDPFMLLSWLNTQLRDFYPTLEELCHALQLDAQEICDKMASIDYHYNADTNQFI